MKDEAVRAMADESIRLDAPDLPQATEEEGQWVIHVDDLRAGEKIVLQIPNYQKNWHASEGDTLRGYLNDTPSEDAVYIDRTSLNRPSWETHFDPAKIPNGPYRATYTKTNEVHDLVGSLPTSVTLEGSTASTYPGPYFPDAVDGVLSYSKISERNGTPVRARYDLREGDQVTFEWQGFDEAGYEVPQAAYKTRPPLIVGTGDVANGYVADTIPLASIQMLGDLGSGVAHYKVLRQDVGRCATTYPSLDTKVRISWSDISELQLTVTQGAANVSDELPNLKPCNYGAVFGEPGLAVTISVSEGGVIAQADSDDPTTYQTQLDGNGLATFSVSSSDQSLIGVTAYSATLVGDPPTANATFSGYADGSAAAGIKGYNYTTHVPSDGITPCSIYFQVFPAFLGQSATVTITDENSHATIVGADPDKPHTRTVTLYSDGTGLAEIVDTVAEKVNVTLSVTGRAWAIQFPYPVQFISFPSGV